MCYHRVRIAAAEIASARTTGTDHAHPGPGPRRQETHQSIGGFHATPNGIQSFKEIRLSKYTDKPMSCFVMVEKDFDISAWDSAAHCFGPHGLWYFTAVGTADV